MLSYFLLFSLFPLLLAFDPSCASCKYYIPNKKGTLDLGLCKMFTTKVYPKEGEVAMPNFAIHCRNDEQMCGKTGFLYEALTDNNSVDDSATTSEHEPDPEIINKYEDLKNRCCGEVNETDELEQLEREFFEIYQKIKKHNRKRIYKTSQELYKLFKKK